MGRQLDAEAAARETGADARPDGAAASTLPPAASSRRRARLLGRVHANAELLAYAEAWARRIQLGQTLEMAGEAVRQPHTPPMVTVALRSDGSVESVTVVRSSGLPAVDAAVQRIVGQTAPHLPFPPALAAEYDVVEIRRTWVFDTAVRLQ